VAGLIKLARAIDAMNEYIGKGAAWAIVIAILVSSINALIRRIFGMSSNGWLELQWYLFGAVFMLCAPWTLKVNEHIRIDIVSNKLSKRGRDWVEIFGLMLFLLPFVAVMIWISIPYFRLSYASGEVSSNAGGLVIWPAKGLILLGFILLGLQWLSELIKRVAIMRGLIEDENEAANTPEHEAVRLVNTLGTSVDPKTGTPPGDGIS
jgi:TRAP-type mannitol/chloroaromatic compound transport system permease small subunit